ncbi:HD domain-containing protein, partial [Halobacterium salinarum]|uniref:HD domain-containing protein n=1 Tax=Halobacterium salinarum TaxID=2242 RepID=UPI001F406C55
ANHTRFEHSLGVYHLADRALAHLDISGTRADTVRAAALLHDIGHGPYGHQTEGIIQRRLDRHHDDVAHLVSNGEPGAVLAAHGLDPDRVAALVAGHGKLGQLVAGELDVDRMDYLVRDAHHTGVPYGTIDHGRLIRGLTFIDGDLVLGAGNVQSAESLLLARALMNPTVYSHHVARISKSMLRRAAETLLATTDVTAPALRRMDDHDLVAALRAHDATSRVAARLFERDLYKRAVWAELGDVDDDLVGADHDTVRGFERAIAADAGVPERDVIVDAPGEPSMPESSTGVLVNGEVRRLHEQSTLVTALQTAQREQWRLGVYTPRAHTDAVGRATERVLGLDPDDGLVTEVNAPDDSPPGFSE